MCWFYVNIFICYLFYFFFFFFNDTATTEIYTLSLHDALPIWQEPVRGEYPDPRIFGFSGLELLQRGLQGLNPIPPISHLTGLKIDAIDEREVVFSMPASDWF